MKRLILFILAAALIGTACTDRPTSMPSNPATPSHPGSAIAGPDASPSTIVLNPGMIWFDPPADAQPRMTSTEAMAAFEAADPAFQPETEPTAHLGFYTAAYRYRHRLAWGFTWHSCAPQYGNPPPNAVVSCTAWLFLNANSGEMLEMTWQKGALRAPGESSLVVTLVLDPPMNTETFAPPGEAQAKLTSSEAVAAFEAVDTEFTLPTDAISQLGLYTAAVGDGTYRFKDQLAWGYRWHQCAVAMHEVPTGTYTPCTAWLFLDANTGEMLELTWQRDSP
jgi:hypothetical protein